MYLDTKELLEIYKRMYTIRSCEEHFVAPISNNEIACPVHLYSGQEAVSVGVSYWLTNNDLIFGNHRSHGHYLAKGGDLKKLIAEIYCKKAGCSLGRGGSMHIVDPEVGIMGTAPIVAGTISLAMGAAYSQKMNSSDKVAVSYFGDGATGEGVLAECLNFSVLKNLPIIYVCENNFYSTHMAMKEIRSSLDILKLPRAYDMNTSEVDGNDVLAVMEKAKEIIQYARTERKPSFLLCNTYRQRGHVGPDDNVQGTHTDIRPKGEIQKWLNEDPLLKFKNNSQIENEHFITIEKEIDEMITEIHKWAKELPRPDASELNHYVFR